MPWRPMGTRFNYRRCSEVQLIFSACCYKLLQAVTNCYELLQAVTSCYKLLQAVISCYKLLQAVTICYKLLQAACCYNLLLVVELERGWRCYKVMERRLIEVIDERGSIIEIRPQATMRLIYTFASFFILCYSDKMPLLNCISKI